MTGASVVEPLSFKGLFRFKHYFNATRRIADQINSSDADHVFVDKCRFFGSPPILQYLKKSHVFYSHEPLGLYEYNLLADGNSNKVKELCSILSQWSWLSWIEKIAKSYERFLIKREDIKSIRSSECVMTSSYFVARWIKRVYGIDAVVNYQGVDTDWFQPDDKVKKEYKVLSVGRIENRKNHHFLVCAIARLSASQRPKLVIVCDETDPNLLRMIERESDSLGVATDICYRPTQRELRDLYRSASLVLCPSLLEPFGLVPLEAMACGTPVIAMNQGGFTETIVNGQTGYLLDGHEPVWASKIQEVLSQPALAKTLGLSGREHVANHWHSELFIQKLENYLYNKTP